jgi:hypothetical protein
MEVNGQLHTLAALLVGKVLLLPTEHQVCTGPLRTRWESNPDYSVVWPVSYTLNQLSYPGSLSCPGRLFQMGNFMVFLSLTRQMPAQYLQLGNDCCLTQTFLFIMYIKIKSPDMRDTTCSHPPILMENLNYNGWKAVGCTNNTDTHNVNIE